GWRRRHSVYTLWAILFGFGFISLFYTGARAKKNLWMAWGTAYGVIVIGALAIGGSLSPKDPDAPTPLGVNLLYGAWVIVWIVSAIHVFRARKEWLRWKAGRAGQTPWYQSSSSAPPTPQSAADLGGIGLDDPTSDYLAPAPSASAETPSVPPPATTAPRRWLPPAPTSPPSRSTDRPLPPPPSAPPPSRSPAAETSPEPIDLNTATVDDIASLPGVGVATARRIVEERNRRGGFESVDEAALAANLQPHVRSRLQVAAVVSERQQPRRRGTGGRIVDI
ncbi:MAG: helix-hairpin-helix domain-containing protein, partial [Actinobacteria bacterium]|nr:helix-hairpin-helix domain-containing protein [Actinomycetota bacterium]